MVAVAAGLVLALVGGPRIRQPVPAPRATVDIIRTAVYFRNDQRAEPFVVQAVWLVCALAPLLICARPLARRPGRSEAQGLVTPGNRCVD